MLKIFGFEVKRPTAKEDNEELLALDVAQEVGDSTVIVNHDMTSQGGVSVLDFASTSVPAEEIDRIKRYRELALSSEIDEAMQEIRNEVFIFDIPGKMAFEPAFDDADGGPSVAIQRKVAEEFSNLYEIVNFRRNGTRLFDSWFVDARIYMQKVVDNKNLKKGIRKTVWLDPLAMRKVKIVNKARFDAASDLNRIEEFYVYSKSQSETLKYGVTNVMNYGDPVMGLKILPDTVSYCDSGIYDRNTETPIGHLYKAIIPYNNLKMMEDAMTIFRVVRAPQRRAIYVDVGSLQKNKADSYIKDLMARFRNRMTYDPKTGALTDKKNIQSMLEDYWLPRRDGSKGTEIQNLEGGDMSGMLEEVEYYRDKLWRALGVPRSRFGENAQSFVFGKGIEIQRDEYRFKKFIDRLRASFLIWFEDMLKTHMVLKNIIRESDWPLIRKHMYWNFAEDNAFVEYKESEILNNRINTLTQIDPFVGKYFSVEFVRKNVLRQSDAEIEDMDKVMDKEREDGLYDDPIDPDEDDQGPFGQPQQQEPASTQNDDSSGTDQGTTSHKIEINVKGGASK